MGWSVAWVFGVVAVDVDGLIGGLSWSVAWVFGAVVVVVDGLCVARGWGRRRGKKKRLLESLGNMSLKKIDNYKEIIKKY